MRIWKWELAVTDSQTVMMPNGAKVLDAQMQKNSLFVWALCDENAEKEIRHFAIYGTGNPIPGDPGCYIGTFQMLSGELVFHVFEVLEK